MKRREATERLNLFLPKALVDELRAWIPARQRTAFITEVLEHALCHLRLVEAIETTAGTWRVEDHPDLTSAEAIAQWVREQRTHLQWIPPAEAAKDA